MFCSCGDPSCSCLEKCSCPSEFCACTACLNLRKITVVKKEENEPFDSVSDESSAYQKPAVTNTDCHTEGEELIQMTCSNPRKVTVVKKEENEPFDSVSNESSGSQKPAVANTDCHTENKGLIQMTCFNSRKVTVEKKEENEPFDSVSNESSGSQKPAVANIDSHTEGEGLIQISCSNPRKVTVVKKEENELFDSISNESSGSQKPAVTNTECHMEDERLIQISSSCDELESDVVFIGSYNIKKEVKKCSSPSVLFSEIVLSDSESEPVVIVEEKGNFFNITPEEPVVIVGEEDNFFKITPQNRNRSRNLGRKGFCHFSNKGTISKYRRQERSWSNRKSNQNSYEWFRKNTNVSRYQNRSHVSLKQYENVVLDNVDMQVNEYNVVENLKFSRYFSETLLSRSAYNAQENEASQEFPVSNIKNNSLQFETNRYMNENDITENSNFNRYFSEASASCSVYKSHESEIMQESLASNIRNNSLNFETNQYINENDVAENSNLNRYFSKTSSSCTEYKSQENETLQKTPVSNIKNNSLQFETDRYMNENDITENSNFNGSIFEASASCSVYKSQENETMQESSVSNLRNNSFNFETNQYINENNVTGNSNFNRYFSEASSSCSVYKSQKNETMQVTSVSNIKNNSLKSETNLSINENNITENSSFNRYFSRGLLNWNTYDQELESNRYVLFKHKPRFNSEKQTSWNNSRTARNGNKIFSEIATILQTDERASTSFGQQTDSTSSVATVMQTNTVSTIKPSTFHNPDVSHHEYSENKSLQNINEGESGCKEDIKKEHAPFLLPPSHNSSEICNDYQENYLNSLQNTVYGESGYEAAKNNKSDSVMNHICHSMSRVCQKCWANRAIRMKICKIRQNVKRKYARERTHSTDTFKGETISTKKRRRKRRRHGKNVSCKVEQTASRNEIKKENIHVKTEIKKENRFVKTEKNYIKSEIKKENPWTTNKKYGD